MTLSETNRAISELLEPKPSHDDYQRFANSEYSAWSYSFVDAEWLPLAWHSPAGMCRLLELMPAVLLRKYQLVARDQVLWYCYRHHERENGSAHHRLPDAVTMEALAYLQSLSPADLEAVRERLGEGV